MVCKTVRWLETIIRNDGVGGSNPSCGTSTYNGLARRTETLKSLPPSLSTDADSFKMRAAVFLFQGIDPAKVRADTARRHCQARSFSTAPSVLPVKRTHNRSTRVEAVESQQNERQ